MELLKKRVLKSKLAIPIQGFLSFLSNIVNQQKICNLMKYQVKQPYFSSMIEYLWRQKIANSFIENN